MALSARNINQAGQAAERAAGGGAAVQERMAANRAMAANSDIVKQETGFSLSRFLGSAWEKTNTLLFAAPLAAGVVGWLGKRKMLSKASGAIGKTAGVMSLPNATFGELRDKVGEVFGENHAVTGAVGKHGTRLVEYAKNTSLGKSGFGQKVMANLKEAQVANTLFNVGFAMQESIGAAMSIGEKARTLQQMQKDLTGESISKNAALMGNKLDPMLLQARKEATSGKAMASIALKLTGAIGNMYLALFDKSSGIKSMGKAVGINMGTNLAASMLTAGNTALQSYRDMHLSMAQTGKADAALYEGLIGGLAPNASSKWVTEASNLAFERQYAPADILKKMHEARIDVEKELAKNPGKKPSSSQKNNAILARMIDKMKEAPDLAVNGMAQIKGAPPKSFVAAENQRRAANDTQFRQQQRA